MNASDGKLTRIGVFYDGNFFYHVSNYYAYHHERRARISIAGLHHFIREEVSKAEGIDARYCHIVDAHYFRGRLSPRTAQERDLLFKERVFDEVLMREGVVTHYLPMGPQGEKGIDVWLALEAFELAVYKRFSVSVLVAGDGDYVPLVRKLSTIGTRVMVLGWDFKYVDQTSQTRETRTAQTLLNEVTYPILVSGAIDDRSRRNDPLIAGLFLEQRESRGAAPETEARVASNRTAERKQRRCRGTIQTLKEGYGFIAPETGGDNLFFFHTEVLGADFNDLTTGDAVEYELGTNDKGPCAVAITVTNRSHLTGDPTD